MPLEFSVVTAAVFIGGGLYCRRIKRLKNTSRGMLFFGCIMAFYSLLTVAMINKYSS